MRLPHALLISLLVLTLAGGCRERRLMKKPPPEVFEGVIDTSGTVLEKGKRGGSMVRADILELDTLNPVTTTSRSVYEVLGLVFEGLLSIHPVTGEIQGSIAREYSVVNNGYSVVLFLNEVLFSDGTPCTVDDVIYTYEEIYMNPDVNTNKGDLLRIREREVSIEKLDDYTVRFDLPVPFRPFLLTLAHIPILPRHILEPIIESDGVDGLNESWGSLDRSHTDVIGTGPYMIHGLERGKNLVLRRNPLYNRREGGLYLEGMPYLDEIVELLDEDSESKILKFQIGELDFYRVRDIDIESGDLEVILMNREEGGYSLYSAGQTLRSNHFLTFNLNTNTVEPEKLSVFQNRLFREAVIRLIDRESLLEEVYGGYGYIDESPERNVSPFHLEHEPYPFDAEEAGRLLDEAGLHDRNGDGFRDLPSGKPFSFTLTTNEDNPFRVRMGEIITPRLRDAGLDVSFKPADYDTIVTDLLDLFGWETVILGVYSKTDPNDTSRIWESSGSLHVWFPYQQEAGTEWERRVDELFALGRTTWSIDKAREYYEEYQRIIMRELPLINLIIPAEIYGLRNGYRNTAFSSVTYNSLGLVPYLYRDD